MKKGDFGSICNAVVRKGWLLGAVALSGVALVACSTVESQREVRVYDEQIFSNRAVATMKLVSLSDGSVELRRGDGACIFRIEDRSTVARVCSDDPQLDALRSLRHIVTYDRGDMLISSPDQPLARIRVKATATPSTN